MDTSQSQGTNTPSTDGEITAPSQLPSNVVAIDDASRTAHLGGPEAIAAVEAATVIVNKDPSKFTASNGIILKIKKVPRLVIVEAGKKIKMPQPPIVYLESKGVSEANPNDPLYLEALSDARYRVGMVTVNVSLTLGTEVKHVPDGFQKSEDAEWSNDLEGFELDIPASGRMRYLSWLKFYALSDEEVTDLSRQVMEGAGLVFQEAVAEATAEFPSSGTR